MSAYSQPLIPKDLPTNDKILYYLIENKECRDVVKQKDRTIDSLKLLDAKRIKAIAIADYSLKGAIKVNKIHRDSLQLLTKDNSKQKIKVKRNRKLALSLGIASLFEAGLIYFCFFSLP